jgi:NADP-reducing hydrogenase subunit HndC
LGPDRRFSLEKGQEKNMSEKKQLRIATRNSGFIDPERIEDYIAVGGYQALGRCLTEMTPAELIEEMKKSGLRGRGGAGFPTGVKWGFAVRYPSDIKYVICNADEGDPGAYMDRAVLEGDPHSVLEGMAIAGYAIGAHNGTIYIRAEYPLAIKRLRIAIEQAEEYGLLGKNIMGTGFSFEVEIKYGAGAFVCGEETALIRSIEGNRGEPYSKPPFPAESGYWLKPTVLNNVETLANIPAIIMKGADWYSSIGSETAKGTKVFSLVGKISRVGLIEVPMGITLKEIIFDIGGGCPHGKKFKALQTGGPSGGVLTYKDQDVPIDYEHLAACESIMGSGGMIVMDEDSCMVAISKFFLQFTMDESCGKCTPCRVGSKRLWELLDKITLGQATEGDIDKLEILARQIKDTALCGLGQTMPNPVLSTLRVFRDEYLAHVRDKKCPAGVCLSLLEFYILPEKCVGCTLCAKVCPVQCISGKPKELFVIDQEKCIKCGVCQEKCKFDAIVRR